MNPYCEACKNELINLKAHIPHICGKVNRVVTGDPVQPTLRHLQLTTVDKLKLGDRFYKATDRKKHPYTLTECVPIKTFFRTYNYFATKDGERNPAAIVKTTQVVFLRSQTISQ